MGVCAVRDMVSDAAHAFAQGHSSECAVRDGGTGIELETEGARDRVCCVRHACIHLCACD